mgnify:CR=1 FL=1
MISSSSFKFQQRHREQQQQQFDYNNDKFENNNNNHGIDNHQQNHRFSSSIQIINPISKYGSKTLTFLYHGCINLMLILLLVTKHKPLL